MANVLRGERSNAPRADSGVSRQISDDRRADAASLCASSAVPPDASRATRIARAEQAVRATTSSPPALNASDLAASPQARLVAALVRSGHLGTSSAQAQLIETHISYVLLTGTFAYKIKKAIRLAFLDFTTLAARRFFCEQELRLNRRLAPSVYLDVVPITGTIDHPEGVGSGAILDYAVKMREFPQTALLGSMLDRQELTFADIDALARQVAAFHATVPIASPNQPFGDPDDVLQLALDNFIAIRPLAHHPAECSELDALEAWTRRQHSALREALLARRNAGFIRECHGDLHLGNMARVDGAITIFDCIEFNDRMRWIDVLNEVAFTVMDLTDRGRPDFANQFLNEYLEIAGDYAGLPLLRFYLVYRAMVRAKVACLRGMQLPAGPAQAELRSDYRDHVRLAASFAQARRPALTLTHGFAGCGKTTLAQALREHIGAIHLRSDVERKRLHGLPARARTGSTIEGALYSAASTRDTYERLLTLATHVIGGGFHALVDATFLRRWQRELFRQRAIALHVPFGIVSVQAPESTLRERVPQRACAQSDASEADIAVLEHQLRTEEPITAAEACDVVVHDGSARLSDVRATDTWRSLTKRLAIYEADAILPTNGAALAAQRASVAYLSQAGNYTEPTTRVERVETHMSWVFLTDGYAFKMKKHARTRYVDLRTVRARRRTCAEEVRLNRRLTDDVYRGIVPLLSDASGRLSFSQGDEVAEWLVKMRRLPADRMLDRLILNRSVETRDLVDVVERLCSFYRQCPPTAISATQYKEGLAAAIAENRYELSKAEYGLPVDVVDGVCVRQLAALADGAMFDDRVRAGRIVEGHGDLRPEHICLEATPQIIDCLDFSRVLRTLDTADELAFLALECERLGTPALGDAVLEAYRNQSGDRPPDELIGFYQSYRACVRARLAILHLNEPALANAKWQAQGRIYLRLAQRHSEPCR